MRIPSLESDRVEGPDWLAPQCRWHPALLVFPANREFYRENNEFWHLGMPETARSPPVSVAFLSNSLRTEQGIVFAEQGISTREQRILSATSKSVMWVMSAVAPIADIGETKLHVR